MTIDVFSIHCDALDGARLAGFKGVEALNRPFELDIFFTVPLGADIKGAVGARATLTADRDDGRGPMCWHGILASIRLARRLRTSLACRAGPAHRTALARGAAPAHRTARSSRGRGACAREAAGLFAHAIDNAALTGRWRTKPGIGDSRGRRRARR